MRNCFLLLAITLVAAAPLAAAEWSGYLMPTKCSAEKLDEAETHTAKCLRDCLEGGLGLATSDGKYIKFDGAGNEKALKALDASNKQDHLLAKVTGTLKDGVIQVDSVTME